MEEVYRQILLELLEEHGLVCGLVASSDGIEYARAGNFQILESQSVVNTLIFDSEAILRLDAFMEGKIMPQMYSQGRVHAYITKPKVDLLVVLFSQDSMNVYERYDVSQAIQSSLMSKLENSKGK